MEKFLDGVLEGLAAVLLLSGDLPRVLLGVPPPLLFDLVLLLPAPADRGLSGALLG